MSEMYSIEIATEMFSTVIDQLLDELKAWRERPLKSQYPIVWMDAIHYKIKKDGRYVGKAVYTLLDLNLRRENEILRFYFQITKGLVTGCRCRLKFITEASKSY